MSGRARCWAVGATCAAVAACGAAAHAAPPDAPFTVPALREWRPAPGSFSLAGSPRIVVRPRDWPTLAAEARTLAEDLSTQLGKPVAITHRRGARARGGNVLLGRTTSDPQLGAEGYSLRIGRAFTIAAPARAGIFYGGRTLLQLAKESRAIPCGRARDWPRYPERGLMLDDGRKYYSPAWIANEMREMAYFKLDYLHLHLSDTLGFRIESDTHPEIVSAQHLTKADVRQLLALAARLHITVVPEIDMPGHMTAALAKHPEFQLKDATGTPDPSVLDVANPAAVKFAQDIVGEMLDLFGGPYYHLGADEVVPDAELTAGRYPGLEAYARKRFGPNANAKDAIEGFVNDMDAFVRAHGRTMRMWNDDVNGGAVVTRHADIVTEWWTDSSPLSDLRPPTPQQLIDGGHAIVNAGWFPTYVVNGVGGSNFANRPDLPTAYESWDVNQFYGELVANQTVREPPLTVAPDEPRNLGAVLHLWNDNPTFSTTAQDAATIGPYLRVMAQKTWDSPLLTPDYATFVKLVTPLGDAPGYAVPAASR